MALAVVRSVDSARSLRGSVDVEEFEQELIDQYSLALSAVGTNDKTAAAERSVVFEFEAGGNSLHVRTSGPDMLDMLLGLIDGAQDSLKLYYYIFAHDKCGRLVLARLIRAARRGVSVLWRSRRWPARLRCWRSSTSS